MTTKQLPTFLMLCLATIAPQAGCGTKPDDDLIEVDDADAEKDDGSTMLEIHTSLVWPGETESVTKVFKTLAAFNAYFGLPAPADIDFTKEWVIYFAAGSWTNVGHEANIVGVRRSASGNKLTVTAETVSPSDTCWQPPMSTVHKPAVLVTIARQTSAVTQLRTVRTSFMRACTAVCGADLEAQLAYGARGAVYVSASHVPYKPFVFDGAGDAGLTSAGFLALLDKPADTNITELDWNDWISNVPGTGAGLGEYDDATVFEYRNAAAHGHMAQMVNLHLTDVKVFDVGGDTDIEGVHPLYIVGKTSCGDVAGYSTKIVAP